MTLPDQPNTHIHNQIISHAPPTTPAITANDTALSPPLLQGSTIPLPTKLEPGGRVILRGLMDNHGKHEPSAWSSSSLQVANSYLNSTEGTLASYDEIKGAWCVKTDAQDEHKQCREIWALESNG